MEHTVAVKLAEMAIREGYEAEYYGMEKEAAAQDWKNIGKSMGNIGRNAGKMGKTYFNRLTGKNVRDMAARMEPRVQQARTMAENRASQASGSEMKFIHDLADQALRYADTTADRAARLMSREKGRRLATRLGTGAVVGAGGGGAYLAARGKRNRNNQEY